jgi:hypothetical protein
MRYFRMTGSGLSRGVACVALLACAGALPAQEIYKSVDAQGNVVYSDRAPSKNAPTTAVHVTEPDPAEVARLAKQQQLLNASDRERQKQEAAAAKSHAALERQQQANCENARNKYYRYKDSPRIYQRDTDGNRVYYTDSEADSLREQARRAMVAACGN